MTLVLIIGFSTLLGYTLAEIWHRKDCQRQEIDRLKAEYLDKQYWQFISIDEWLNKNKK